MASGVTLLTIALLTGCGNSSTTQKTSNDDQSAKVASLKKENAKLKQSSAKKASSKTASSSQQTSSSSESTSTASSETVLKRNNEGATASSLRNSLVYNFGCDAAALNGVSDTEIIDMSNASSSAGEDIGGFYKRVKAKYSNIGGNVLGKNADSSSSDSTAMLSEDSLPWAPGAKEKFDHYWSMGDRKIIGFKKWDGYDNMYAVYVEGDASDHIYVTVNTDTGWYHG